MSALLVANNIKKYYGSFAAVENVSLTVEKGTIHAIIGENGAGKSTLMNILAGVHEPTDGEIVLNGQVKRFKNATDAARSGIGMVQQEFMLFPELTVLENIILGHEPLKGRAFLNMGESEKRIRAICSDYGFRFDLHAPAGSLPIVQQQQVEIVKVLFTNAEIIILDEPTAVLPPQEVEGLFKAVRFLVKQGKTIIFITHKLKEVMEMADTITVMKKGTVVCTIPKSEATIPLLTNRMVGRDVMLDIEKHPRPGDDVVLSVSNLCVNGNLHIPKVKHMSFDIRAGEIVGIVGVSGNGQSELVEALSGIRRAESGTIKVRGQELPGKNPRANRLRGIGYVPQDRNQVGCSRESTLVENSIMGKYLKAFRKRRFLMDYGQAEAYAGEIISTYDVRTRSPYDKAGSRAGGKLQKLSGGREGTQDYEVLIIEDPTRGIDVGAIEFIWNEIVKQVEQKQVSVLLITYDLNEAMTLSDRILVMFEGGVQKELTGPDYDEKEIGFYMLGGNADETTA